MSKQKNPLEISKNEAKKLENQNTRGKNAAGQTQGQNEKDAKHSTGHYTGAGEAPLMRK